MMLARIICYQKVVLGSVIGPFVRLPCNDGFKGRVGFFLLMGKMDGNISHDELFKSN